jgi:L-malate glycosyltransferase
MLTVLFATRNRARLIRSVLETYCKLKQPSSGWKLVVIDNGSTDQTAQVIAEFAHRLPLQTASEPRMGKNVALNAGLGLLEGDLAIFTDDDAFPHADWLLQFRKTADDQPMYSIFGGKVLARWESPPPHWIGWVNQKVVYAITDPSLREGMLEPYNVFGPNMAIRADVFQAGLRFDTTIGPKGASYPMGSETELLLRLGERGQKAWHVPDAVVEHFIRKEQLTKHWVLQRAINFGRGQYRLFPDNRVGGAKFGMGTPLLLFRKMLKEVFLMSLAWISVRQEALFRSRWRFNYLRGQAIEGRVLARHISSHL